MKWPHTCTILRPSGEYSGSTDEFGNPTDREKSDQVYPDSRQLGKCRISDDSFTGFRTRLSDEANGDATVWVPGDVSVDPDDLFFDGDDNEARIVEVARHQRRFTRFRIEWL